MMLHRFVNGAVASDENGYIIALLTKQKPEKGKVSRGTWFVEYTGFITPEDRWKIEKLVEENLLPGCKKLVDKTNKGAYKRDFF